MIPIYGEFPDLGRRVRVHHPWLEDGEEGDVVERYERDNRRKIVLLQDDGQRYTYDLLSVSWEYL